MNDTVEEYLRACKAMSNFSVEQTHALCAVFELRDWDMFEELICQHGADENEVN